MDFGATCKVFTDAGHPSWEVRGNLGAVTYRSLGNVLYLEPANAEPVTPATTYADEVLLAASTGSNRDVYTLLIRWYAHLPKLGRHLDPEPPADAGTHPDVAAWSGLRGAELTEKIIRAPWYAHPNDLIGGWCITVVDAPPSSGALEIGSFLGEDVARHVAELHNAKLRANTALAEPNIRSIRSLRAEIDRIRDLLEPGDVVHVPAGADDIITTTYRFLFEEASSWGISGPRITAAGKPIVSRSVNQTRPDGYLQSVADWTLVRKCTVLRGDQAVYTPEDQP